MKKFKKRIFDIIQIGQRGDFSSRAFDFFLVIIISLNILVLILETFNLPAELLKVLHIIEIVTIALFGVEYLLRIWTAEFLYPNVSRGKAIVKFLFSYDGIVDLLTILPAFFLSGFSAFRMLRVVRIFHLFRINATYDSFNVITAVLKEKRNQIFSSLFIVIILMFASSLCMYSVENVAQPDVFDNAFSGMWWSISTILTVGYGDIYPITVLGRILAIIIAILGVGVVAIPTGIISAGFVEHYNNQAQENKPSANITAETISGTANNTNSGTANNTAEPAAPMDSLLEGNSAKHINLCERILADREATDPETREKFDNYLAELLRKKG